ncbi:hypothetical protein HOG98_10150 [bacterium]|jgi:hypothetical protein|nr:hypothetical protein [bacterium]
MKLNTKKSYFVLPEIESSLLALSKQTGTYIVPEEETFLDKVPTKESVTVISEPITSSDNDSSFPIISPIDTTPDTKRDVINTTHLDYELSTSEITLAPPPNNLESAEPIIAKKINYSEDSQIEAVAMATESFEQSINSLNIPYEVVEEKSAGELDYETEAIASSFTIESLVEPTEDVHGMQGTTNTTTVDEEESSAFDIIETVYPPTTETTSPFELDSYILETAFKENTSSKISLFESPSLLLNIENIAFSDTVEDKNKFLLMFNAAYSDLHKTNELLSIDD